MVFKWFLNGFLNGLAIFKWFLNGFLNGRILVPLIVGSLTSTNLTISQMSLTYQWKMRSRESSELIQYPRRLRQRNAEDSRNHQQAS